MGDSRRKLLAWQSVKPYRKNMTNWRVAMKKQGKSAHSRPNWWLHEHLRIIRWLISDSNHSIAQPHSSMVLVGCALWWLWEPWLPGVMRKTSPAAPHDGPSRRHHGRWMPFSASGISFRWEDLRTSEISISVFPKGGEENVLWLPTDLFLPTLQKSTMLKRLFFN